MSSLAHIAHLCREPDPASAWDAAERAWHDHGVVCLPLAELEKRRGWGAARQARQLAEIAFGPRKGLKR